VSKEEFTSEEWRSKRVELCGEFLPFGNQIKRITSNHPELHTPLTKKVANTRDFMAHMDNTDVLDALLLWELVQGLQALRDDLDDLERHVHDEE
jgi:hypothetical protein